MTAGLLGVGLDAQYASEYPLEMTGLCRRLAEKLSHVSIVSLRSREHAQWFREACARGLPIIHHLSGIAPAASQGPNLERYDLLDGISRELGAVWSCEDIAIWSLGPLNLPYFTAPLLSEESVVHIAAGLRELVARGSVPFLAEIPSFTLTAGELGLGEFFGRLAHRAGCDLVADVSHVFSYALCASQDPLQVLRSIPLERVVELHVAGGRVESAQRPRYVDTHSDAILPGVMAVLRAAARECPRLRAVTFELGVGLTLPQIESDFAAVSEALAEVGFRPGLSGGDA